MKIKMETREGNKGDMAIVFDGTYVSNGEWTLEKSLFLEKYTCGTAIDKMISAGKPGHIVHAGRKGQFDIQPSIIAPIASLFPKMDARSKVEIMWLTYWVDENTPIRLVASKRNKVRSFLFVAEKNVYVMDEEEGSFHVAMNDDGEPAAIVTFGAESGIVSVAMLIVPGDTKEFEREMKTICAGMKDVSEEEAEEISKKDFRDSLDDRKKTKSAAAKPTPAPLELS